MHNLNKVIGTYLCKMLDNIKKDISIQNSSPSTSNNCNELSKLGKKLEHTRGAYAFTKDIGDEKRIGDKLELYLSLEKEIDE